jgi:hypothetical protein
MRLGGYVTRPFNRERKHRTAYRRRNENCRRSYLLAPPPLHHGYRQEPLRMVGYPIPRKADMARSDGWEPSLKVFEQLTVDHGTSDPQKQMRASLCPTHVLSLAEPSSN